MQELSSWVTYCNTMPARASIFGRLTSSIKSKLVAADPLEVCKSKYPETCRYLEALGGVADPCFA